MANQGVADCRGARRHEGSSLRGTRCDSIKDASSRRAAQQNADSLAVNHPRSMMRMPRAAILLAMVMLSTTARAQERGEPAPVRKAPVPGSREAPAFVRVLSPEPGGAEARLDSIVEAQPSLPI